MARDVQEQVEYSVLSVAAESTTVSRYFDPQPRQWSRRMSTITARTRIEVDMPQLGHGGEGRKAVWTEEGELLPLEMKTV